MCPHTIIYVSLYYCNVSLYHTIMCPHISMCVLILQRLAPHTAIHLSWHCCICVGGRGYGWRAHSARRCRQQRRPWLWGTPLPVHAHMRTHMQTHPLCLPLSLPHARTHTRTHTHTHTPTTHTHTHTHTHIAFREDFGPFYWVCRSFGLSSSQWLKRNYACGDRFSWI